MNQENWKDIEGLEGKYQISDKGDVKSLVRNEILKKTIKNNFHTVTLLKKHYAIGYLVAKNFIPNDNNYEYIRYLDKDTFNNNVNNLEWASKRMTLNLKKIIQYDENGNLIKIWDSMEELLKLNIQYYDSTISNCMYGKNKTAYGFIWRPDGHTDDVKPIEKHIDNTNLLSIDEYEFDKKIEHWKDIKNFENRYRISSFGDVKSLMSDIVRKKTISNGYYCLTLIDKNNKEYNRRINILVAEHFIEKPKTTKKLVVDHIDNDRLNNHVDNLQWLTHSGNSQAYCDNFRPKKKVLQYDLQNNLIKEWNSVDEIMEHNKEYKRNYLMKCCQGNISSAYNCKWKYKNIKKTKKIKLEKDEIFKNIGTLNNRDFSDYDLSNYGKVRTKNTKSGYLEVTIGIYNRVNLVDRNTCKNYTMTIHKLVASVFVEGQTKTNNYVNHIDEDKHNNYYKNLEWISHRNNIIHSYGKRVHQIDSKTGEIINTFDCIMSAAIATGMKNSSLINRVCKGKRKHCRDYKWQYADTPKQSHTLPEMETALLQFNQDITTLDNYFTELENIYHSLF